ncbi:response regulator [Rhodococcus oryzae]|uniref:response regulator n=1 Tax=Rhodococcus oryzae TaxID=2571143 RepID=UPI00371C1637
MTDTQLRIAIADDQPLMRAGYRGILEASDGFTVVGEAENGHEAVSLAARERPDVVLMDIRMPGMDGIEATRQITASTSTRVLILTTFDIDQYVYGTVQAGASGFLFKDTRPNELLEAIRIVAAGEALLAPSATRRLITDYAARTATNQQHTPRPHGITAREREVLTLIAQGLTNAQIAQRLYITEGTTKTHVSHLLTKLDARDRVHLVIIAYQARLVS